MNCNWSLNKICCIVWNSDSEFVAALPCETRMFSVPVHGIGLYLLEVKCFQCNAGRVRGAGAVKWLPGVMFWWLIDESCWPVRVTCAADGRRFTGFCLCMERRWLMYCATPWNIEWGCLSLSLASNSNWTLNNQSWFLQYIYEKLKYRLIIWHLLSCLAVSRYATSCITFFCILMKIVKKNNYCSCSKRHSRL